MIYEFIATLAAAFGMAGLALIITHLSKLIGWRAPKWIIPLFAALGIFGFQIYQEYHWFEQKQAKLPKGVVVVKKIEDTAWFRPWSFIKPQTVRFIAADIGQAKANTLNPDIKLVNLYLFERRMSVHRVPQMIDCGSQSQADYLPPSADKASEDTAVSMDAESLKWIKMADDDPLFQLVCVKSAI